MVLESETAHFEPGYCFLLFILPLVSSIISYAVIVQCHRGIKQITNGTQFMLFPSHCSKEN